MKSNVQCSNQTSIQRNEQQRVENTTASPFVEWEICSKDYNTQQSLINDFCLLLDTHSYKRSEKYLTGFFIRLILFVIFILSVFVVHFFLLSARTFFLLFFFDESFFFPGCGWGKVFIIFGMFEIEQQTRQMFWKTEKNACESKVDEWNSKQWILIETLVCFRFTQEIEI